MARYICFNATSLNYKSCFTYVAYSGILFSSEKRGESGKLEVRRWKVRRWEGGKLEGGKLEVRS